MHGRTAMCHACVSLTHMQQLHSEQPSSMALLAMAPTRVVQLLLVFAGCVYVDTIKTARPDGIAISSIRLNVHDAPCCFSRHALPPCLLPPWSCRMLNLLYMLSPASLRASSSAG